MKQSSKFKLFSDSGKKIKVLSQSFFVIEVIASICGGIVLTEVDSVWGLLIPAGIIFAYLSNLFLYGFGEIVDNSINSHNV